MKAIRIFYSSSASAASRIFVVIAVILGLSVCPNAYADADADFSAGVSAFHTGEYEIAADHFESARNAGMKKPVLFFDLGLCYYKLGRDIKARSYFTQAAGFPEFAALSEYQLGLVDYRSGNTEEALKDFDAAVAADPRMKERVNLARERITGEVINPVTSYFASLGVGYDSNVNIASGSNTTTVERLSDTYEEAVGVIEHQRSNYDLSGIVYYRHYNSKTDYDQLVLDAELLRKISLFNETGAFGFGGAETFIGNKRFQTSIGPRFYIDLGSSGDWKRHFRYSGDRIIAVSQYDYLTGWRHQIELSANTQQTGVSYQFEFNDRNDLQQGQEFFSQSPLRHRIFGQLNLGTIEAVSFNGSAQIQYSDYRQANQFLVNGVLTELKRKELFSGVALQAHFPETFGLLPFAEARASFNNANLDELKYNRFEVLFGAQWSH